MTRNRPTTEPLPGGLGPGRRRRARRRLFAAALAALVLGGQELAFRLAFPLPEVTGFNRVRYQMMAGAHPNLRATLKRGLVYDRLLFESEPDGFSEVHRLNVYGFRGPDFAIAPPRGRRRVLLIGDSVTEGQGAPESGTIAAEFSRLLAADGVPAEVINLGVVAANLVHLTALARDATGLLRPTDVVFVLFANDLPAPRYARDLDGPAPPFPRRTNSWEPRAIELVGRAVRQESIYTRLPRPPMHFFAPAPDRSNPLSGTRGTLPGLDPALYRAMFAGRMNPWLYQQAEAIPVMLAHDFAQGGAPVLFLRRVDEACKAVGARLVVAYVPFCGVTHGRYARALEMMGMSRSTAEALAVDPVYRGQNRMLAELCPRLGLPLADATDDLARAEAAGAPQFWSFDTHPRPAGYVTIARHIHQVWRASAGGGR
jgi:lysophospholipase L1-like esterase